MLLSLEGKFQASLSHLFISDPWSQFWVNKRFLIMWQKRTSPLITVLQKNRFPFSQLNLSTTVRRSWYYHSGFSNYSTQNPMSLGEVQIWLSLQNWALWAILQCLIHEIHNTSLHKKYVWGLFVCFFHFFWSPQYPLSAQIWKWGRM